MLSEQKKSLNKEEMQQVNSVDFQLSYRVEWIGLQTNKLYFLFNCTS